MAVKIRLARRGRKKLALYDIVVADARAPRDGLFIEKLGNYNPNTHPATILLKEENALQWLLKGAQPTNTARTILSSHGVLLKKHLQVGVAKGAITQEVADTRLEAWKKRREREIEQKDKQSITVHKEVDTLKQQKASPATQKEKVWQAEEKPIATATSPEIATQPSTKQTAAEPSSKQKASPATQKEKAKKAEEKPIATAASPEAATQSDTKQTAAEPSSKQKASPAT